ncbi:MAG: type II toxin-antitoxin system RelE/ParE family toxin [Bryobacteraceae bacterium]|nr:type II toxin-antitoxin system RelE/ParE family toxin [Bryobacteraceae bacterium]
MTHRLTTAAETQLDEIWLYIARETGNLSIADRTVDSITERFCLLARYPHLGRRRDHDLRSGLRSFPVGEFIVIYRTEGEEVLILSVLRGSRNIAALLDR